MRCSTIIRSDDLRSENIRRLLQCLRHNGPCTPAESANLSELSPASISLLTTRLINQGVLLSQKHSASRKKSTRGRPLTQLTLSPLAGHCITASLSIDLLRVKRVNYAGDVCEEKEFSRDTRAMSNDALLECVCQSIRALNPPAERHKLHHIGVAFQGMTEHHTGTLLWSPVISGKEIPLGQVIKERFGVPCSVNNDARLISQALSQTHQDTLGQSFATILFSYGIGLGLYLDDQPFAGTRSSALEIGHLRFARNGAMCRCGKQGCIEAYAADYGIKRMAEGLPLSDVPAGRVPDQLFSNLVKQAQHGNRAAMRAFTTAGEAVGEGLGTLFTLLDPMPVALVGHSNEAFELMRGGIETAIEQHSRHTPHNTAALHCHTHHESLLDQGLICHTLSEIDTLFASTPLAASS